MKIGLTGLLIASLFYSVAFGQEAPNNSDAYWQQMIGQKEAQSAKYIIDLARELDKTRAKVQELTKQLEAEKARSKEPAK